MTAISIFEGFTKTSKTLSLEEIINIIKSDAHKEEINRIRIVSAQLDKDKANELKKQLLAFSVSGHFRGGRKIDNLVKYNHLIVLDIDSLTEEQLINVKQKAPNIPYSCAGFVSPSGKGYKIIVKIDSSIEMHKMAFNHVADFYEKELNVKIDRSGKDVVRLCFLSWDNDAFFRTNSMTFSVEIKTIKTKAKANKYNRSIEEQLDHCLKLTERNKTYQKGNRNNFIYHLAANCNRAGIEKEQVLIYTHTNYDLEEKEQKEVIDRVYQTHSNEFGQSNIKQPKMEANFPDVLLNSPFLPDHIFQDLPPFLKDLCALFKTPRERDVFLTSALGILSGCLSKVQGLYDRSFSFTNLFCFIIGPAASGKGVLKYAKQLANAYHQHLIKDHQIERNRYNDELAKYNRDMTKYMKNSKLDPPDEPERPSFPRLFIPANSSFVKVVNCLRDSDGRGIICETEADTLGNILKTEWGSYSDLLRKAFHSERISISRKEEREHCEIETSQLAIAISGTPNQVLQLIPSAEDGLFSRFVFYTFNVKPVWRDVSPNTQKLNLDEHFKTVSKKVLDMILFLEEHPTIMELTDQHWNTINETFSGLLKETNAFIDAEAISSVKRLGLITFRIAMILTAFRKAERKDQSKKVICSDQDFNSALSLAKVYYQHAMLLFQRLPHTKQHGFRKIPQNKKAFFNVLPKQFKREEAIKIGAQFKLSRSTVDRMLSKLSDSYLEKVEYGIYRKKE